MPYSAEREAEIIQMEKRIHDSFCIYHIGTSYSMVCKAGIDRTNFIRDFDDFPCDKGGTSPICGLWKGPNG